ncbi:hypothetical protein GE09DRAFT_645010 [Coniochaeta sp. 2T2.1]|nr:hypothetical protein GE09DRAFT_645010 [Coniochaeta sp. 2T2.1]
MTFQFIDNSIIDRRTRKLIRSHVMQGINKGRTITRPSKKAAIRKRANTVSPDTEQSSVSPVSSEVSSVVEQMAGPPPLALGLPIGHRFSSVRLPIEPGPYARRRLTQCMFHHWLLCLLQLMKLYLVFQLVGDALYPPEFCSQQDHVTSVWFEYMSTDAAFLHCTIAMCASFIELFLGKTKAVTRSSIPPDALAHIAHAFRLTNGRLSSEEALTNNTMASVVSLSLHEQLLQDYATGRIHLQGLARIVSLRGGLLQLPRELAHKICRCDIDVALHEGTAPLLHYPGISGAQVYALFGTQRKHSRLAELHPYPELDFIAADISTITDFLNSTTKPRKLEPIAYQDLVIDLGYRLLDYRSLSCQLPRDSLQVALHLSLTAFLTTFILQFGYQRRIHFNSLSLGLRDALRGPWTCEPANRSFLLWALVVAGISEFGPNDHQWLLPAIRFTAAELGVRDWQRLQAAMLEYPWARVLHDESAKTLWDLVSSIEI